MLLDKYKRDYKYKSRQSGSDKYLWIGIVAALIIGGLIWYFG